MSEASDEIDRQVAEFRKGADDDHSVTHTQTVSGPTIDNRNQINTPQMVAIIVAILISCLALSLWYNTSSTMQLYEREIRLAQRDAQDAKNQTNTLKEVLEIVGLKVPKKDDDK